MTTLHDTDSTEYCAMGIGEHRIGSRGTLSRGFQLLIVLSALVLSTCSSYAQIELLSNAVKKIREGVFWGSWGYPSSLAQNKMSTFRGGFSLVYGPVKLESNNCKKMPAASDSSLIAITDLKGNPAYRGTILSSFKDTSKQFDPALNLSVTLGYEFSSTFNPEHDRLTGSLPVSGFTAGVFVRVWGHDTSDFRIHLGLVWGIFAISGATAYFDTTALKLTTESTIAPEPHVSVSFPNGKIHFLFDVTYQYLVFKSLRYESASGDVKFTNSLLKTMPSRLDLSRFHIKLGLSFPIEGLLN